MIRLSLLLGVCVNLLGGTLFSANAAAADFPSELVDFVPYKGNPLFTGTGHDTWDRNIRERGYILKEGSTYHMWYTGYNHVGPNPEGAKTMSLGYATSPDGITWKRYSGNPIFSESWVEDVHVVKHGDTYYMFAEGRNDIAHMLTSKDRVHWKDHGKLDVRYTTGKPLSPGPYGTPTVFIKGSTWYLFYERGDLGIWLATSKDRKIWTNVQDDPVIAMGPEHYDRYAVAVNQIIEHKGNYYAYYHATSHKQWRDWTSNVAVSTDLVHWKKYKNNPIVSNNKSSPILVHDGGQYRLYTMHPDVRLHYPAPNPDNILLQNYRPQSLYKIPKTRVLKPRYPIIDMHSHPYAKNPNEIAQWVANINEVNIEKVVILTQATGDRFDSLYAKYAKYPGRFELWCGLDYSGYDRPGFGPEAVAELERCYKVGARGVGELGDKGKGLFYCKPQAWGMHLGDPRMDPLLQKCAELGMPVNIHVADPMWMYQTMDKTK